MRFSFYKHALEQDRIISIPGHKAAEFQGIAYDYDYDCVYRYTLRIGPDTFSIEGVKLIQGPRRVETEEFMGNGGAGGNENPPPAYKVDPEVAKIKKAEYDKYMKFKKLVTDIIDKSHHPQ